MWKYVLFLNNVFPYRLFIGYSPIGSTVSIEVWNVYILGALLDEDISQQIFNIVKIKGSVEGR
jgi:hypothetical protein